MKCLQCGAEVIAERKFCEACGAALQGPGPAPAKSAKSGRRTYRIPDAEEVPETATADMAQKFDAQLADILQQDPEAAEKIAAAGMQIEQIRNLLEREGERLVDVTARHASPKKSKVARLAPFLIFIVITGSLFYAVRHEGGDLSIVLLILLSFAALGILYGLYKLVRFIIRMISARK